MYDILFLRIVHHNIVEFRGVSIPLLLEINVLSVGMCMMCVHVCAAGSGRGVQAFLLHIARTCKGSRA